MSSTKTLPDYAEKLKRIRAEFPILQRKVKGKQLVYLDNAASTQKPRRVINAISHYYEQLNANVHRGIHTLSEEATLAMEESRAYIAEFINAGRRELVFTKGTTESINLLAHSYGNAFLKKGDAVLISEMEHHANIVPWQQLRERIGIELVVVPVNDKGELDMEAYRNSLSEKVKLVSLVHTSNALGTMNPIEQLVELAHEHDALVHLDAAQAIAHSSVDVKALDIDFMSFSAHKVFGPTGTGAFYGKEALLEKMPPFMGGGEMIEEVTFEKTTYNEIPYKFEPGTPNIAGNIVFSEALKFTAECGFDFIQAHEANLLEKATNGIIEVEGVRIIGEADRKASVLSFVIEGVHHQDLALMMDTKGIALRTGHHCTQPLMHRFGISGTTRASFSLYNTEEEVDYFLSSLSKVCQLLKS